VVEPSRRLRPRREGGVLATITRRDSPVLPLRAQLSSSTGTCWEAEFRADGVTKSTPTVFGAKPHVGSPSGAFVD
jgi:hypothetical protein